MKFLFFCLNKANIPWNIKIIINVNSRYLVLKENIKTIVDINDNINHMRK